MGDGHGLLQRRRSAETDAETRCSVFSPPALPDLRTQQPRGLRDEPMLQVGEDDVVVAVGDRMVEGDRPLGPARADRESDLRQRPGIGQRADAVAAGLACRSG